MWKLQINFFPAMSSVVRRMRSVFQNYTLRHTQVLFCHQQCVTKINVTTQSIEGSVWNFFFKNWELFYLWGFICPWIETQSYLCKIKASFIDTTSFFDFQLLNKRFVNEFLFVLLNVMSTTDFRSLIPIRLTDEFQQRFCSNASFLMMTEMIFKFTNVEVRTCIVNCYTGLNYDFWFSASTFPHIHWAKFQHQYTSYFLDYEKSVARI